MYGKSNLETYIAICKIDSQWEFAVGLRKLKQGLCYSFYLYVSMCLNFGAFQLMEKLNLLLLFY